MRRLQLLVGSHCPSWVMRPFLMGKGGSAVLRAHGTSSFSSSCSIGGSTVVSEAIAPEMVTIEILPAAEVHCSGSVGGVNCGGEDVSVDASAYGSAIGNGADSLRQKHYWDVTNIDNFAKSRVLNYVRRAGNKSADVFEICKEQMFGKTVYRARCKLLLPPPHYFYVAEGVGEDEKDAELLAAMHAERVCDTLGVPLFRLPSMQQKYAENVRRQGRYAPMPGDLIKPEGTIAPPPLRMVVAPNNSTAAVHAFTCEAGGELVEEKKGGCSSSVFSTTITEAEIVNDWESRCSRNRVGTRYAAQENISVAQSAGDFAASKLMGEGERGIRDEERSSELAYHTTVHYPWISYGGGGGGGGAAAAPSSSTTTTTPMAATCFDPTEGGLWQMVNANSTRCSPSPDALLLPCVYDAAAHERLKDHFLQQAISLKDRVTISHVAVPGHSVRMYVAEIRLYDAVVARGKAQTKESAEHLAAMHAELMLDALARPLFPRNSERQAGHAVAAERFGRWAPNPLTGDLHHPRPNDALPLPLKQQVGGDEVWLDPQMLRRYGYQRSIGERIIAAHNEVNNYCGDYIETNPDPKLLAEARQALEAWQRNVARNPHPDLFVITRMGDQFRASTLLPVPKGFGIRGGNAVGKTMEQAMDLCALHAVDTLCALGIPLFSDTVQQRTFIERRRRMGLVTPEIMAGGVQWENGLVAILAPSLLELGSTSPAADTAGGERTTKKTRPPYLPGYMVEGNQQRPLPHIRDTMRILQLHIPDDFVVYGENLSDDAIVEIGNEAKVCVQNYLRYHQPKDTNVNASVYITGYGRQVSVHNIAYLPLVLPPAPTCTPPSGVSGTKRRKKKVCDAVTLTQQAETNKKEEEEEEEEKGRAPPSSSSSSMVGSPTVPCDPEEGGKDNAPKQTVERLLAVGISLKKKDAERVCYLHAVDMLRAFGQDVLMNYRAGLPRRKLVQTDPAAQPPRPGTECGNQQQDGMAFSPSSLPKPYMHKLMKNFMTSGRHHTMPKKRQQPGPFSPF